LAVFAAIRIIASAESKEKGRRVERRPSTKQQKSPGCEPGPLAGKEKGLLRALQPPES
jgi:hypothetical protein